MQASKAQRITGWILSVVIVAFLLGASAPGKFTEWEGKDEMFQKFGFTNELMEKIGVVEIAVGLLFLIPRTSFVAAILITGYLGGATVTHLRVDDPWFMPIVIGVLVWVAYGLRHPVIFKLALGNTGFEKPATT